MATAVAFRVGDVVRLRSGGPPMTVRGFLPDDMVLCQCFEHGACCAEAFPATMLEPAPGSGSIGGDPDDHLSLLPQ